jgi:2-C-methyl-D-erythritol 4-phosphate cytidylyltransferase
LPKIIAVITAGGSGTRMRSDLRKQYIELGKKPVLAHTVNKFSITAEIGEIVITAPEDDIIFVTEQIVKKYNFSKVKKILPGGKTRQESVYKALQNVDADEGDIVLIHDGVRPFVSHEIILGCIEFLDGADGAVAGIRPVDTIKKLSGNKIESTLNRDELFAVQTPQAFRYGFILKCHEQAALENFSATDDSALAEKYGERILGRKPVMLISEGSPFNIKITTQNDLVLAEALMEYPGL